MTPMELQGHCLIQRGLLSQAEVAQIWPIAGQYQVDLCEVLLRQNRITQEEAQAVRDHCVRTASQGLNPNLAVTVVQSDSEALARHSSQRMRALQQPSSSAGHPSAPSAPTGPPKELGPYSIVGVLSQGGMGIIYRGRHPDIVSDLAIKTVLNGADQLLRARFKKEIEALSRVDHDNVVKIVGSGEANGCPFLAMELVEGQDLQAYLLEREATGEGPLEIDWICDVFASLAEALHACHEEGLIHRDIKPQNIMLNAFQRPILVDFGIAKVENLELDRAQDDVFSLTKTGQVVGTPAFMAPEQLVPDEEFGGIGPATDVWGLATSLYFALTGQTITEVSGANFQVALLTAKLPGPQATRPDTPDSLEKICQLCLQRNSNDRPTMAELADLLRAVKTKPKPLLPLRTLVLLSLLTFLIVTGYFAFTESGTMTSLQCPAWSNNETFTINGRLTAPWTGRIETLRNSKWILFKEIVEEELEFQWSLPLQEEGPHQFRIVSPDGHIEKEWTTSYDRTSPKITVTSLESGQVFVTAARPLSGTIAETNLLSLKWNGRDATVENGQFSIPIFDSDQKTEVIFEALDRAGNKTQMRVMVVTRNAVKALKTQLLDREKWNACSKPDQDLIISLIQSELGEDFQFIEMTSYGSGLRRHRLARFVHLVTGIEFVIIPGGRFYVGTPSLKREESYILSKNSKYKTADLRREKALKVTMKPLLVSRFETTEEQWHRFTKRSPKKEFPFKPARTMTLSEISEGLKVLGNQLRLPTEIEWEWVARGGSTTRFPWGDELDPKRVWFKENALESPHSVFEHTDQPNAFGLVDVIGNVLEWTSSPYHPSYESLVSNARRPKAFEPFMTIRGGHHKQEADMLRTARRHSFMKSDRSAFVGFRLVRSLD